MEEMEGMREVQAVQADGVLDRHRGAVVTETVFSIPGMGQLVVQSVLRRDYPVIQGVTLIVAASYVLINLLVDVLYLVVDPRVKY